MALTFNLYLQSGLDWLVTFPWWRIGVKLCRYRYYLHMQSRSRVLYSGMRTKTDKSDNYSLRGKLEPCQTGGVRSLFVPFTYMGSWPEMSQQKSWHLPDRAFVGTKVCMAERGCNKCRNNFLELVVHCLLCLRRWRTSPLWVVPPMWRHAKNFCRFHNSYDNGCQRHLTTLEKFPNNCYSSAGSS